MKRCISVCLILIVTFACAGCHGYNDVMRAHLCDEEKYAAVEATLCSYKEVDDRLYVYVNVEDASAFDASEQNGENIRLEVVGTSRDALAVVFSDGEICEGDPITVRCSTWIYMDGCFYYIAELRTPEKTYLSFDDGMASIRAYVNGHKSLF